MGLLLLGLVLFLGVHSVRIVADSWRTRMIGRIGLGPYKGFYSAVAIAGFVLLIWGYGAARSDPTVLWVPPVWTRHLAALLTLPAFVLLAAAYVPRNRIRARLQHPMVLGVKLWALAHLLANGTLADVLLFGSFLVWAILDFRSARRRSAVTPPAPGTTPGDLTTVVVGIALWLAFALWLHRWLIGVAPFA